MLCASVQCATLIQTSQQPYESGSPIIVPILQLRKFRQEKKKTVAQCTTVYDPRNQATNAHVLNFGLYCLWAHCLACEAVPGSVTVKALGSQPELPACLSLHVCMLSQFQFCLWLMMLPKAERTMGLGSLGPGGCVSFFPSQELPIGPHLASQILIT